MEGQQHDHIYGDQNTVRLATLVTRTSIDGGSFQRMYYGDSSFIGLRRVRFGSYQTEIEHEVDRLMD